MESNKKYWKGLEELNNTPEFVENNKGEFSEALPVEDLLSGSALQAETPRRGFLKTLGFGLGAVTLAACGEAPIRKSIPYLVKPEEVTPGIPNYYASSFGGQGVMVKTREGRPIKIEGNQNCPISGGAADARAQASVLDLYDSTKLKAPLVDGTEATWEAVDKYVVGKLTSVRNSGKKIAILSSTLNSPSAKAVLGEFAKIYPNTRFVAVDAVSYTGIIKANENSFAKPVVPHYHFEKADVIVSFGADFLGSWISPVEFTRQYVSNRNNAALKGKKMSRHVQFESAMTTTGTNADVRVALKPSEQGLALLNLYSAISGVSLPGTKKMANARAEKALALVAKELVAAKGRSLVVSGSNDVSIQTLVNAINSALGNYGATINLDNPSLQYSGNDADFVALQGEMKRGEVGALIFWGTNPVYSAINAAEVKAGLDKVPVKISFAERLDETFKSCNVIAPNHHFLESWGDSNPLAGLYLIQQPTINPVFDTRAAELSLLKWAGSPVNDYYEFVKGYWQANILNVAGISWDQMLQTGVVNFGEKQGVSYTFSQDLTSVAAAIKKYSDSLSTGTELLLYSPVSLRDGAMANNPLLQEMPDPVSKVTWDNYAALAPKYAEQLGVKEFDLVEVKSANYSITLPVLLQPGQALGSVAVALGYGRTDAGKVGSGVGQNAYPFVQSQSGTRHFENTVTISKVAGFKELALTQTHHSIEGRDIIRETSFKEYLKDSKSGSGNGHEKEPTYDLWDDFKKPAHDWVMAIDLNACTGCGACIVACNTENNVPVVGRDEVRRRREMHWIRIDRYYSFNSEGKSVTEEDEIATLTDLDDVSVIHQPMMCQHCDHASCETVCPVLATVHSSEGLNHMAYNRCFGTRYCANNCPYKVRRFNWFNYWNDDRFADYMNNEFTQLVLNPDVTTRFRGVMEKCSMCIQRIQAGKLKAKMENRTLKDGDVKVACQQTCPAGAIIFGDRNDPESLVSKALKDDRTYYVLESINVQPGVGYMTKVRNSYSEGHQA